MDKELMRRPSAACARYSDFVVERGEGMYLYTSDGRKVPDFCAGTGATYARRMATSSGGCRR